jgi:hypothetical protein
VSFAFSVNINRLIFAAAIGAAVLGAASAPSRASDLAPGVNHVRISARHWNWFDRCAWAGYYCLYAWRGYVYHYPFDDRANAYGYRLRRHR